MDSSVIITSLMAIFILSLITIMVIFVDGLGNTSGYIEKETTKEIVYKPIIDNSTDEIKDLYERLLQEKDKQISQVLDEVYFNREIVNKLLSAIINNLNLAVDSIKSNNMRYVFDNNNNMYLKTPDNKRYALEVSEAEYVYYNVEGKVLEASPKGPKLLSAVNVDIAKK